MKKRLLSMIVAVAMTFTLVSCSGNSSKKMEIKQVEVTKK